MLKLFKPETIQTLQTHRRITMKRIITKQNHYKSLLNTINRHPEFAEGKSQLQGMIVELEARERRISGIISDIFRPVSFFYAVKQQAELELNQEMLRFTSMGELVAVHKKDDTMHYIMKKYQSQLYKVSAYKLYCNAISVADILEKVETNHTGTDFTSRQLPEFRKQAEAFGVKLTTLADQLLHRKVLKKELAALIASTNLLLREQLDHAVNFFHDTYPDLYREYMLIRKPHNRKRRTTKKDQPQPKAVIHSIQALTPSPAIPEPKQKVTETKPVQTAQLPVIIPIISGELNPEIENQIPADYLAHISKLISAPIRSATLSRAPNLSTIIDGVTLSHPVNRFA